MTFAFSIGRYGGFRFEWGDTGMRLVLGIIAFDIMWEELDETLLLLMDTADKQDDVIATQEIKIEELEKRLEEFGDTEEGSR